MRANWHTTGHTVSFFAGFLRITLYLY